MQTINGFVCSKQIKFPQLKKNSVPQSMSNLGLKGGFISSSKFYKSIEQRTKYYSSLCSSMESPIKLSLKYNYANLGSKKLREEMYKKVRFIENNENIKKGHRRAHSKIVILNNMDKK